MTQMKGARWTADAARARACGRSHLEAGTDFASAGHCPSRKLRMAAIVFAFCSIQGKCPDGDSTSRRAFG